jgi:hypothetical protein
MVAIGPAGIIPVGGTVRDKYFEGMVLTFWGLVGAPSHPSSTPGSLSVIPRGPNPFTNRLAIASETGV